MVLMERAGTAQDVNPCSQLDELSLLAVWHPHGLQTLRIDLSRVLIYLAAALKYIKMYEKFLRYYNICSNYASYC